MAPPELAVANDWMPLASTGAARFRTDHPTADGRGVLIAILDTGVDPAVPGLATTTTSQPKIADLRDFSGEGTVALRRVEPDGDSVQVGSRRLGGFGRVRAVAASGPWYAGAVAELPLGVAPAADLNGNGVVGDTLPLVVARATDGWVVFPDRDGDGSLAGERPVADYLRARDWFGWSRPGRTPPAGIAVNLDELGGEPRLTLVYDLDSHGTHVAGIAAGHGIYATTGLDGTAPGAQLLGLKIANAGQGSVSTGGAIARALDYAIGFAAARRQPLVVNLSFGVGNEVEGGAAIDRLLDSVLRRHPDVVLAVSAGNDGPGLSSLGAPGSARRGITVGATIPRGFLPPPAAGGETAEPIAFFSGRGGELAKPELVAPGVAYSTVPRWDAGDEVKQGTSMAAPQVAGIAALLLSALREEGRGADG
ncbi:MAG TPA: S8 family serine peptidase, partial [Gemmatimonadales bacterium]|nr:S8 family serine peptidase [Gemmatimonadales bacterium]